MSVERKLCGCLITTTVLSDGGILKRTDWCKKHEKEWRAKQ